MSSSQVEKECIEAHNAYRKCHGADPLIKDRKLTAAAQKWAEHLAKNGRLEHSNNKLMGENVAYSSKTSMTGYEICKIWYDEIKDYNFSKPGFAGNTGHFTQVVWKGSTQIGVGVATGSKGTFAVANYSPAGNITNAGFFEKNVKRATGTPKLPTCNDKKEKESKGHKSKVTRNRSRSSSSSSSSDDENSLRKAKPGTTVKTTTEEYVEDGQRKRKTITVTTTISVTKEGTKKSTKTNTKIETIESGDKCGGGKGGGSVYDKLKKLNVSDSDSSSSEDDDDDLSRSEKRKIREECLSRHNELRKRHSAPKLKKNRRLQRAAQKHANKMLREKKLSHSSRPKYGENVAMKMPTPSGDQICDMWYDEKKDYNFDKAVFSGNTGHFTQVVWEGSTDIGIGVAASKDGRTYVAAYYDPPGNVSGHFAKNVHRR